MGKIDWEFDWDEEDENENENEYTKMGKSYDDYLSKCVKVLTSDIDKEIMKELYKLGKSH